MRAKAKRSTPDRFMPDCHSLSGPAIRLQFGYFKSSRIRRVSPSGTKQALTTFQNLETIAVINFAHRHRETHWNTDSPAVRFIIRKIPGIALWTRINTRQIKLLRLWQELPRTRAPAATTIITSGASPQSGNVPSSTDFTHARDRARLAVDKQYFTSR